MRLTGILGKFPIFIFIKNKINTPYRIALISIIFWSTQATSLSLGCKDADFSAILFPAFVVSSLSFLLFKIFNDGDSISKIIRTTTKNLRHFIIGSSLIFGSLLLFYWGLQIGPKIETNLTNFLWPLLLILLGYILFNKSFINSKKGQKFYTKLNILLGNKYVKFKSEPMNCDLLKFLKIFFGFSGIVFMITHGNLTQFQLLQWKGPLLGFIAGLFWAIFSIYLKFLGKDSYIASFIMGTAFFSGFFWFTRGCPSILPSLDIAIYLGLLPLGLAMWLWEKAMKNGYTEQIGTLGFLLPLFSTLLLIIFGFDYFDKYSIIGMSFIVIANMDIRKSLSIIKKKFNIFSKKIHIKHQPSQI